MFEGLQRLIFKFIYRVYLWSTSSRTENGLSSRILEYPFVLKTLLDEVSTNGRILVVGCSSDPLTTIIPALGYETYGLDIKFTPVKYPNLKFVQADIRKTDFPDNWFDGIATVSTIEHIGIHEGDYEGDKKAINEMKRILKPGGILLITVPVASRFQVKTFERTYDLVSLKLLLRGLKGHTMTFYRRDKNGYWIECLSEELPDPDRDVAVALISTVKHAS